MHLKGKAAIVTGGGRGIGRDVALLLAKEGASVVVNDPGVGRGGEATAERPADDVVAEIKKAGGKAVANYDSVADYQKAGAMVRQCVETFGKIDILVNVAGMLREKMIWNMSEDDFDAVVSVHLKGHWNMSHHAIKYMRNAGYGRIINFSTSVIGLRLEGYGVYGATKAAIEAMTQVLSKEMRGRSITVNAVAPGPTATELFLKGKSEQLIDHLAKLNPLERLGTPEDIAGAVSFLAGPDGAWINGQVLRANGGMV